MVKTKSNNLPIKPSPMQSLNNTLSQSLLLKAAPKSAAFFVSYQKNILLPPPFTSDIRIGRPKDHQTITEQSPKNKHLKILLKPPNPPCLLNLLSLPSPPSLPILHSPPIPPSPPTIIYPTCTSPKIFLFTLTLYLPYTNDTGRANKKRKISEV